MSNQARNFRILIERPEEVRSATGAVSTTWGQVADVWARRLTEKGVEAFTGSALLGKVEVGFAILNPTMFTVDEKMRVTYKGRIYSLASAVETIDRKELILLGTAGANRG
jgi:SPP1 family predicted phage head-tail adaptor